MRIIAERRVDGDANGQRFAQTTDEESEATTDDVVQMDEIVVTGRKRDESLQDIPVSISVLDSSTLADQNVLDQGDLADLIPGLWYNEGNQGTGGESDRIAALPSIRGISSSEIATNRTKVSSFVDGIPVIGSVGAINIGGATQVEVYNGPQSAAFGRSTFAGAINYVTQDPSDELSGTVGVNVSDQGTRIISGSLGGPVVQDLLSFHLGASLEDSVAPYDFYTYSDGTEAGTRGGTNYSARFVFTPTDKLSTKLTFSHDETDDGITARNFYATQASAAACAETLNSFDYYDDMGMVGSAFAGTFDCELERDANAGLLGVQDVGAFYRTEEGQALIDSFVAAIAPEDLDAATQLAADAGFDSIEEAMLALADAYSVTDEYVGSQSERDRVQLQADYLFDNDSMIQLSFMTGEEFYIREYITYDSDVPYQLGYVPETTDMGVTTPAGINWSDIVGMAGWSMSDPTNIDETYAEVRWASPAQERLRYVLGASLYEYDFLTEVWESAYNAERLGTLDAVVTLTGTNPAEDVRTISEITTNTAVFINASYDFTDKLTGSIEARYSEDDVGAKLFSRAVDDEGDLVVSEYQDSVVTKTISPRLALNYAFSPDVTAYAQWAIGVNPAGVNSDFLNPDVQSAFYDGYYLDFNNDGELGDDELYVPADNVNYDLERYQNFDEETLTNYELGIKGTALDGRLSYSAAVYHMIWEDSISNITIDWDYAYTTNDEDLVGTDVGIGDLIYVEESEDAETGVGGFASNQGESTSTGIELQANFRINDNWSISGNTSYLRAEYTDFCSEDAFSGNETTYDGEGAVLVYADAGAYAGLDTGVSAQGNDCYVYDGKQLARQPEFTLSLSPSFRTEFDNGIGFSANARFQYSGESYNEDENISINPDSFRVNLTFGLSWQNFSGSFYIENLLDETNVTYGNFVQDSTYEATYGEGTVDQDLTFRTSDASAFNYSTFEYSIPTGRNFGLRANYRF